MFITDSSNTNNVVLMGYITGAFGILGWVKIKTSTEEPDSLNKFKQLLLLKDNSLVTVNVEKCFAKNDIFHAKLENISNRDDAIALKGTSVGVWRKELPDLATDEYYWIDLIGLTVINQQQVFGTVDSMLDTGANSVLVINSPNKQHLIPFIGHFILDVDFTKKQITVDWELDY